MMTRPAAGSSGAAVLTSRAVRALAPLLCLAAAPQETSAAIAPPSIVPLPAPTQVPVAPPTPTPGPSAAPAPRPSPSPRVTPTPRATPAPRPAREQPAPTATRRPPPTVEPRPTPHTPVILPAPAPVPTLVVPDVSGPPPTPPPGLATQEAQPGTEENWAIGWLIGLGVATLLAAALFAWRWRSEAKRREAQRDVRVPTGPMPPPKPQAAADAVQFWTPAAPRLPAETAPAETRPAAEAAPRAHVAMTLAARRAGLNLLSAMVEVEVEVRNEGAGQAEDVAVALHLLGASAGQDAALGGLFAAPPAASAQPPFALAPGETRTIRSTLSVSRAAIIPLVAGERQMFVPVVAVDIRYGLPDGGTGQTAAAYMVGAKRPDSDKLAPFWLDAPPRTLDEVDARPHALSIAS